MALNDPVEALVHLRAGTSHLLQAAVFFTENTTVLDACARHTAKRVQFIHGCLRRLLKQAFKDCEPHQDEFDRTAACWHTRQKCQEQYDNGNQEWWLAVMKTCSPEAQQSTLKWLYLLDPSAQLESYGWPDKSKKLLSLPTANIGIGRWEPLLRCSAAEIARYKQIPCAHRCVAGPIGYPWQQIDHTIKDGIITSLAGFQTIEHVPDDLDGLTIQKNYVCEIPLGVFSKCTMLQLLDLSGNRLTSACTQEILKMKTLTILKLRDNTIDALPPDFFKHLPELAELDVALNRLTSMPVSLAQAPQLWSLCCSKNYLPTNHRDEPAIAAWDRERPCCATKWCLAYGPQNSLPTHDEGK